MREISISHLVVSRVVCETHIAGRGAAAAPVDGDFEPIASGGGPAEKRNVRRMYFDLRAEASSRIVIPTSPVAIPEAEETARSPRSEPPFYFTWIRRAESFDQ